MGWEGVCVFMCFLNLRERRWRGGDGYVRGYFCVCVCVCVYEGMCVTECVCVSVCTHVCIVLKWNMLLCVCYVVATT
jgi:hypothetical protein